MSEYCSILDDVAIDPTCLFFIVWQAAAADPVVPNPGVARGTSTDVIQDIEKRLIAIWKLSCCICNEDVFWEWATHSFSIPLVFLELAFV
jgi:hypothetical protein